MGARVAVFFFLLVGLVSAGEGEAPKAWEEYSRRGMEIAKRNGGELTVSEIREAADQFFLAAEAAVAGGHHGDAVEVLKHRTTLLSKLEDYEKLLSTAEFILRIQEKMGPKAEKARYETLLDIGYFHSHLGNPGLAIGVHEKADAGFRKLDDGIGSAEARVRLADACRLECDYSRALRLAEESFPVLETRKDSVLGDGKDEVLEAEGDKGREARNALEEYFGAIGVLARIHIDLGNHGRAADLLAKGMAVTKERFPLYRAEFHLSLGEIHRQRALADPTEELRKKALEKAEEHFRDALEIFFREQQYQSAARAMDHLCASSINQESYDVAITYALAAFHMAGSDFYISCQTDLLIAEAYLGRRDADREDLARAREEYGNALVLARHLKDPTYTAWAETGLAEVCFAEGKIAAAVDHLQTALSNTEASTRGLTSVSVVHARPGLSYLADLAVRLAFVVEDPAVAFELLDRSRACAVTGRLGGRERINLDRSDEVAVAAIGKCRAAVKGAAARLECANRMGDFDETIAQGVQLRRARDDYRLASEKYLAPGPPAEDSPPEERVTLVGTQASLQPDEALVEYAFGGGRLHAMVITKKRVTRHELGSEKEVNGALDAVISAFARSDGEVQLEKLRALVIDGLGLKPAVERVLVSPDGALSALPLGALLPDLEVAFVPSADCRRRLADLVQDAKPGKRALAMGAAVYDEEKQAYAQVHRGTGGLGQLRNSLGEIEAVTSESDKRLTGKDATEAEFRKALGEEERWRVIHISSHGVVNVRQPAWSALVISPDDENDGYLAVAEIVTMSIPADLAVLSACSTARGKSFQGEGTIALPCAFLQAGTPRVLASLWEVDDRVTKIFMTEFYRHWRTNGDPAALALKKTQEWMRGRKYERRHWAAWVLWGLPD